MSSTDVFVIGTMSPRAHPTEDYYIPSASSEHLTKTAIELLQSEAFRDTKIVAFAGSCQKPYGKIFAKTECDLRRAAIETAFASRQFTFVTAMCTNTVSEAANVWSALCKDRPRIWHHISAIHILYDKDHIRRATDCWRDAVTIKEIQIVPHATTCPLDGYHHQVLQTNRLLWKTANWGARILRHTPLSRLVNQLNQPTLRWFK